MFNRIEAEVEMKESLSPFGSFWGELDFELAFSGAFRRKLRH